MNSQWRTLTPRPPLPEGEGERIPSASWLPSPSGRGAGGEGREAKPRDASRGFPALLLALALLGCGGDAPSGPRMIVLGFDGLDYEYMRELMEAGELPNFSKLAETGGFQPLGTSAPPLSPVAWSNFITGMDSGGHGIFDFMHRDPDTMIPYLSTSKVTPPDRVWKLGGYQFASGGGHELLRHGTPFWETLEAHGVPTHIVRIPANFPVTGTATHELSGMGTPDVLGTYGIFHFYTSKLFAFAGQDVGGGEVHEVWPEDGVLETELYGPPNPFVEGAKKSTAELVVYVDPDEERAKFVVGDEEVVLEAGEWSAWVPVEFEFKVGVLPMHTLQAQARFYLRSVRPELEFYVSPINYDPYSPEVPMSHPESFATDLARLYGDRYYTQGMPEETNALRERVITQGEFLAQAALVEQELVEQYELLLDEFQDGLFFYYFGNTDLVSHMMWHTLDPEHPAYDAERDARFAEVIPDLYRMADRVVGYTLEHKGDDTTLVVMSDHGFASWRRSFSVNTWLEKNGYLKLRGPYLENDPGMYVNVDWSGTRAYGLGINGLYVNERGRERNGIVDPAQRAALLREIGEGLLAAIDPQTGGPAITNVYVRDEYFKDRGALEIGPDMVIGYAEGTRGSNDSALGEVPPETIVDNLSTWTGDHGMDHRSVPGILLYDRPLKRQATSLQDLAAALLAELGIEQFPPLTTAEEPTVKYVELARR